MRIEEQGLRQRGDPRSAAILSSRIGAVRSTPSRTVTDPLWAAKKTEAGVPLIEAAERQSDQLGLVAARQASGEHLDVRNDVRAVDCNDRGHKTLHYVIIDIMTLLRHVFNAPPCLDLTQPALIGSRAESNLLERDLAAGPNAAMPRRGEIPTLQTEIK